MFLLTSILRLTIQIGGYMTSVHWRYVFALVSGLGALSIITVAFLRPDLKNGMYSVTRPRPGQTYLQSLWSGLTSLDFPGVSIFVTGVALIILATSWGGSTYPWGSAAVLIPLITGPLLLVVFVIYQQYMVPGRFLTKRFPRTIPVIPYQFFREKDVTLVCLISASTGAALYSAFYFAGVYFTLVKNMDPAEAGIQLLYYVPGIGIGVYSAIFMCNVYPRQTITPLLIGTVIETGGIAALSWAIAARGKVAVNVLMAVAGLGTGIRFMPENLHLTGMYRDRLAPILGLLLFSNPFGGTLALTVMGSVFQNKMAVYFTADNAGAGGGTSGFDIHSPTAFEALAELPPEVLEDVRATAANAISWAFISILPFLGISIIAASLLGNVWVSKNKTAEAEGEVDADMRDQTQSVQRDGRPEVLTGIYFRALLRRTVEVERHPGPLEARLDQLRAPAEPREQKRAMSTA